MECDLRDKPEELLRLNPYAKVPVLVDGDAVIYVSAVINEYLDEKFPRTPLMPRDPVLRSQVRIWIDFCNTRLQAAAGNIRHDHDVENNRKRLAQHLATLDRRMAGRDFIVGDYSLADITYIPFFTRQDHYQASIGDDLPNLKRWRDSLLERPKVKATP